MGVELEHITEVLQQEHVGFGGQSLAVELMGKLQHLQAIGRGQVPHQKLATVLDHVHDLVLIGVLQHLKHVGLVQDATPSVGKVQNNFKSPAGDVYVGHPHLLPPPVDGVGEQGAEIGADGGQNDAMDVELDMVLALDHAVAQLVVGAQLLPDGGKLLSSEGKWRAIAPLALGGGNGLAPLGCNGASRRFALRRQRTRPYGETHPVETCKFNVKGKLRQSFVNVTATDWQKGVCGIDNGVSGLGTRLL